MDYVYFNSRDELIKLRIERIVYFEGDGNYTQVTTANNLRALVGMNLSDMERALAQQLGSEASLFVRVGKRHIVNKRYIYKISLPKQTLTLTDFARFAFTLPVSHEALRRLKHIIVNSLNQEK